MSDETNEPVSLDRTDTAILKLLGAFGRMSMTELAGRVGLSKTPVLTRVRRLEESGFILGYAAQLSWKLLGMGHVTFVEVRLSDTREAALQAFRRAVIDVPEIAECHMIAGGFDFLLKVRTRDIDSYRRFMGETISTLPNIASTSTYVVMEVVKEAESPLSGGGG